jgi:glutamyl-tRNA synthetase
MGARANRDARAAVAGYIGAAAACLPDTARDGTVWSRWTQTLKQTTDRRGRTLFHPLRLALTGENLGPELAALLPLIGPAQVETRLLAAAG